MGKIWKIPENAARPERINKRKNTPVTLLGIVKAEKNGKVSGGIYHKIQIELTYNSNHIEGSKLTYDQTRYIYETNTIGDPDQIFNVDDIVETANHFRCIDMIIEQGAYKRLPNEVGGRETTLPEEVQADMKKLLALYNSINRKTLDDIMEFHVKFERIHPFQDGNGRIGRLLLFKECLCNNIVPFIIDENLKMFYYRGLHEWNSEKGYLRETCLMAQDQFKKYLDYFRIPYQHD